MGLSHFSKCTSRRLSISSKGKKYGKDELQNAVQLPLPFWSASEAGRRQAHLRAETFKTNGTGRGRPKNSKGCPESSWLRKHTVRLPKSALIVGCGATFRGQPALLGMKTGAIHVYFSHLEAMRADAQQSEQNLSHFLWTSIKYKLKVYDAPESSSFNQEEQPIRIACCNRGSR